jgi:hypothetical protein
MARLRIFFLGDSQVVRIRSGPLANVKADSSSFKGDISSNEALMSNSILGFSEPLAQPSCSGEQASETVANRNCINPEAELRIAELRIAELEAQLALKNEARASWAKERESKAKEFDEHKAKLEKLKAKLDKANCYQEKLKAKLDKANYYQEKHEAVKKHLLARLKEAKRVCKELRKRNVARSQIV